MKTQKSIETNFALDFLPNQKSQEKMKFFIRTSRCK